MNKQKLQVLLGLAGTTKTSKLLKNINSFLITHPKKRALIVAFNKKKAKGLKSIIGKKYAKILNQVRVMTLHALCLHTLTKAGRVKSLKGLETKLLAGENLFELVLADQVGDDFDFQDYDKESDEVSSADFNRLLKLLLEETKIRTDRIPKFLGNFHLIAVDEVQDLNDGLIQILVKLANAYHQPPVLIAGDPFQRIFGFINSLKEKVFSISENPVIATIAALKAIGYGEKRTYLKKNLRSTASIIHFVKAYLCLHFKDNELLKDLEYEMSLSDCSGDLPEYHLLQDRRAEADFAIEKISKIKEQSIAIISTHQMHLKPFREAKREGLIGKPVAIETIHKYKGAEADIVFFVGYHEAETIDEHLLRYVGFSRSKKQLFITTSHRPSKQLPIGRFQVINRQRPLHSARKNHKKIKINRNFSRQKIQLGNIETLVILISSRDAPYLPYVMQGNLPKKNGRNRLPKEDSNGLKYVLEMIHRPKGEKIYKFCFHDLNLLIRNGFSDRDRVDYLIDILQENFDNRLAQSSFSINRIDLAEYTFGVNKETAKQDFLDHLQSSNVNSIQGAIEKGSINTGYKLNGDCLNDKVENFFETIYGNFNKDRHNSATLVGYSPDDKDNENRFHRNDCMKRELRLKGKRFIKQKKYLGKLANLYELKKALKDPKIHRVTDLLSESLLIKHCLILDKSKIKNEKESNEKSKGVFNKKQELEIPVNRVTNKPKSGINSVKSLRDLIKHTKLAESKGNSGITSHYGYT